MGVGMGLSQVFFVRSPLSHCCNKHNLRENVGGDRSFHGVDRLGYVNKDGQKRGIITCRVASDALASDVKAYDAGQIQVRVRISDTPCESLKCASFIIFNQLCSSIFSQVSAIFCMKYGGGVYAGTRGVGGSSQTSRNVHWQHRNQGSSSSGRSLHFGSVSGVCKQIYKLFFFRE